MMPYNPVFCALDTPDVAEAVRMGTQVSPYVGGLKLGLEFFMKNGAEGYRAVAALGHPIFLDVKLHDIPNTVAGAVRSLLPLNPAYITIHTSGGPAMMREAAKTATESDGPRPKLLGVTVLTSLDADDLVAVGQPADTAQQVMRLARLAQDNGLDGVICAAPEVADLRAACGPDFVLMVPGTRPSWAEANDQKRILLPRDTMLAGATHLVIGRPITSAADPVAAAERLARELAA